MDNFFIISNLDRDPKQEKSKEIADYLIGKGKTCDYCSVSRFTVSEVEQGDIINQIPAEAECVLILGGDGTIIQLAGELARKKIPLIGINLGKLGFLAEIDKEMIYPSVDKLIENDFFIEERMMLKGTPVINGASGKNYLSLNDVVISRSGPMRVVDYDIYVNDMRLTTISGDGVVISTPTGSTGYSMSAGGPIVEPGSRVILVTPISAHKLNSRPVVLSPEDVVRVEVVSGSYKAGEPVATASFDGGITYEMGKGDSVIISRADEITKVIKLSKENFLEVLSRKLSS